MGRGASDLPTEQWTPHYKVFLADGITPFHRIAFPWFGPYTVKR